MPVKLQDTSHKMSSYGLMEPMVREVSIASILLTILGFCFQASAHHEIRDQVQYEGFRYLF